MIHFTLHSSLFTLLLSWGAIGGGHGKGNTCQVLPQFRRAEDFGPVAVGQNPPDELLRAADYDLTDEGAVHLHLHRQELMFTVLRDEGGNGRNKADTYDGFAIAGVRGLLALREAIVGRETAWK